MNKVLSILAVLVCIAGVNGTAMALDNEVQVQSVVAGKVQTGVDWLAWRASASMFSIPAADSQAFFGYTGPVFTITDWLWIAPQIGYGAGWLKNDALDISLWIGLPIMDGAINVFAESEILADGKEKVFYGFYSLDILTEKVTGVINFGGQAEVVDKDSMTGAHVGHSFGPLYMELQWFLRTEKDNGDDGGIAPQTEVFRVFCALGF